MNEELLQFELYRKEHDDAIKGLAVKIHEDLKAYCKTYWQLHKSVEHYKKSLVFGNMPNVADALSKVFESELSTVIIPRAAKTLDLGFGYFKFNDERKVVEFVTSEGEEDAEEKEDI
jgi:phage terminase small subunit